MDTIIKTKIGVFDGEGRLLFELPRLTSSHPRTMRKILKQRGIETPYRAVYNSETGTNGYKRAWVPSANW